jgi:hypothetical protein
VLDYVYETREALRQMWAVAEKQVVELQEQFAAIRRTQMWTFDWAFGHGRAEAVAKLAAMTLARRCSWTKFTGRRASRRTGWNCTR